MIGHDVIWIDLIRILSWFCTMSVAHMIWHKIIIVWPWWYDIIRFGMGMLCFHVLMWNSLIWLIWYDTIILIPSTTAWGPWEFILDLQPPGLKWKSRKKHFFDAEFDHARPFGGSDFWGLKWKSWTLHMELSRDNAWIRMNKLGINRP